MQKSSLIVLLFLTACSPATRFNKLINKYPFLLNQYTTQAIDTIITPGIVFDTILTTTPGGRDTFFLKPIYTTITTGPGTINVKTDRPPDTITRPIYYITPPDQQKQPILWNYIVIILVTILALYILQAITAGIKKAG